MKCLNNINENYNVGLYIRLSREDETKSIESESIKNQKSLLLQYVKENNLKVYDIYIDYGYSGTNFDRPNFNRLIKDIEEKKVNMVITKDMSRLGRDYIGTGNLIEKYFPEQEVRYIAVTDNIDTFLDNSINDIAPFKAIMNDMYAKDISKKIKSSLSAKQKDGKWVGGRAPFGYTKDINNKNCLIVNEEQAIVVKKIFKMCLDGFSFFKIAKQLTEDGIKTPASYYPFKWRNDYNINYGKWHPKTIKDILTNRNYTGDLVQNKRNKINYKVKKVIKNDPSKYIIVENTHEAIIDKKIFNEVQKRIPKNVGRNEKKENNLLDGLLYCGDCGHRISVQARRKKDNRCYTICNYYRTYLGKKVCTCHCNNYDVLEQTILELLRNICLNNVNKNVIKESIELNNDFDNKKEITLLENEIKRLNENIDTIYIDKINKAITNEQYKRINIKLNSELINKYDKLNILKNNVSVKIDNYEEEKVINNYIDNFLKMKNPSRELIVSLIKKIEIFEDRRINLILEFKNNLV